MSSSDASGTNSFISGARLSVLLPNRIVAICVNDPIGLDSPRRTLSTPAMNVVATAPNPGVRTPSRPVAGAIDLTALPEEDLEDEANFFLRCNYGCTRREAAMLAGLVGGALLDCDGWSLNTRIGFAPSGKVARYTNAIRCTAVIHAVTVS